MKMNILKQRLRDSVKIYGVSRLELAAKLILYSFAYGFFIVNIVDLTTKGFPWYHIFLTLLYFYPFLIVCLMSGFENWELLAGLGLASSLMNDLFYAVVSNILFHGGYNLQEWFIQQLGFRGLRVLFNFQGGFFTFPVTSLLMGVSIYARAALVTALLWKWWREP
jgi:hypothetical protein